MRGEHKPKQTNTPRDYLQDTEIYRYICHGRHSSLHATDSTPLDGVRCYRKWFKSHNDMSFVPPPFKSPAHGHSEAWKELKLQNSTTKPELTSTACVMQTFTCCFGRKIQPSSFLKAGWHQRWHLHCKYFCFFSGELNQSPCPGANPQ